MRARLCRHARVLLLGVLLASCAALPVRDMTGEEEARYSDPKYVIPKTRGAVPSYPLQAALDGIEGEVLVTYRIAGDGSTTDIQVEKSQPAGVFDQVSVGSVSGWRYREITRDGYALERPGRRFRFLYRMSPCPSRRDIADQSIEFVVVCGRLLR